MTTLAVNNLPVNPTIPLTPEVRAAYQQLYDTMQQAIDSTMDLATMEALNTWQPQVDQVIAQDDKCKLSADTAIFEALLKQIDTVNDGIKNLRDQISAIASHFAMAGDIMTAIDKVLALVPGA